MLDRARAWARHLYQTRSHQYSDYRRTEQHSDPASPSRFTHSHDFAKSRAPLTLIEYSDATIGRNCPPQVVVLFDGRLPLPSEALPVALHVAIRGKSASNLDGEPGLTREIDLKPIVSSVSGRDVAEFGTVRPRVQIPGPRPTL